MDETLLCRLHDFDLMSFEKELLDLGAICEGDLMYLEESDLRSIGISEVKAQKLLGTTYASYEDSSLIDQVPSGTESYKEPKRVVSRLKRRNSMFWQSQLKRPKRLIFIRHGESEANVNRKITETVPDQLLHLTTKGREQALDAGVRLRALLGDETVKFTVSPYTRTRETTNGILHAWGSQKIKVSEDVRIREQEHGNFDSPDIRTLHKEKNQFGAFYYRFPNGESPADCFDRASMFLETLYRSWEDNEHNNHVFVSHGMMILVILVRLMRMDIQKFECFESLKNCEFVVLERPNLDPKYDIAFTWAPGDEKHYHGLRVKDDDVLKNGPPVWNGDPDAPLLTSDTGS